MSEKTVSGDIWTNAPDKKLSARPVWPAVRRGMLGTCPNCGSGKLFYRFLKSVDHCPACHEDLTHQRADDLPAYLVIVIVGHLVVGGFMMTDLVWPASDWVHLAIWTPLTLLLSLIMIQPIKGGVIGLQWAMRMHGFGDSGDDSQAGDRDRP